MKRKITIVLTCAILIMLTSGMLLSAETISPTSYDTKPASYLENHTVFAEYATTTWCPQCPPASEALYEIYQEDEFDINYVSLISDVNPNAKDRVSQFVTIAIPTVYFDGGYSTIVGNGGDIPTTKQIYIDQIQEAQDRTLKHSLSTQTEVTFQEPATLSITVTIENTGNQVFIGFLKTYITEILSRWNDFDGNPYHFGLLDFAVNQIIILPRQSQKTISVQWDGAEDHNGISFGDITKDNIKVISSVFHWIPHLKKGYESDQFTQRFPAFYCISSEGTLPKL